MRRNEMVGKKNTKVKDFGGCTFMDNDLEYDHVFVTWTGWTICH